MLQPSIKVSLIVVRVDQLFDHQVLTLANSPDNPSQTPLLHLEGRTILTKTDVVDRGWSKGTKTGF
jgi:hypothetical protein